MTHSRQQWEALAGRRPSGAEGIDQWRGAQAGPRAVETKPAGLKQRTEPRGRLRLPDAADSRDGLLGNHPLTELGTSRRFVERDGDVLRYVPEAGMWLVWEDGRWAWDRDGARVRVKASSLHRDIYAEGAEAGLEGPRFATWARECQKEAVIRRVVALASDQPEMRHPFEGIDGQVLLAGLDRGRRVIDLRSGAVRSSKPDDFVTRSLGLTEVGQSSRASRWKQFLGEVFSDDEPLISWLQTFLGYGLTGMTSEQIFLFAHGGGANGKSVLLRVLEMIWGDYARVIQPETLMLQTRASSGPTPDIARLAGARLVFSSEIEEGRALSESLVKQLTGGDTLTARNLHAAPFEFRPAFKLIVAGNHRPRINGTDNGIWRRIRILPFARSFAPHQQDVGLVDKLLGEAPDILAWLVEGAQRYLDKGLPAAPAAMSAATDSYRVEEDLLGQWIGDRTDATGCGHAAELHGDYRQWCEVRGYVPISLKAFGLRLAERGYGKGRDRAGAVYSGISLAGRLV